MSKLLNTDQTDQYKKDGAVLIKVNSIESGLKNLERVSLKILNSPALVL